MRRRTKTVGSPKNAPRRSHQRIVRHIPCHYFDQCGKRATLIWKPTGQNVCKMHGAALIIAAAQKAK